MGTALGTGDRRQEGRYHGPSIADSAEEDKKMTNRGHIEAAIVKLLAGGILFGGQRRLADPTVRPPIRRAIIGLVVIVAGVPLGLMVVSLACIGVSMIYHSIK